MGWLGHHATISHLFVSALIKYPIDSHRSHVHIRDNGPTKELVVEAKSGFKVACVEFVPADGSGGRWFRSHWRRRSGIGREHRNSSALRVGHHSEACRENL